MYASIEVTLFNFGSNQAQEEESVIVRDAIFIKQDSQLVKVAFHDLLYLKSDHVYVEFHCTDGRRFAVRSKLLDFLPKLSEHFLQVHRRYVVNLQHVAAIGLADVTVGNELTPLSKAHKDDLLKSITRT